MYVRSNHGTFLVVPHETINTSQRDCSTAVKETTNINLLFTLLLQQIF
jgi:hypothetical protein